MTRTRWVALLIAASFAASVSTNVHAQEFDVRDMMYDTKGNTGKRQLSGNTPNERIDPFSGNLIVSHVDLSLPGRAGLDLKITRSYNSKIHENYGSNKNLVPPSVVGLGWTLHMGRMVKGPDTVWTSPNSAETGGSRYYEAPDGGRHLFYQAQCGDGSLGGNCSGSGGGMYTKGLDRLTLSSSPSPSSSVTVNFPILATADGRIIEFAHSTLVNGYSIWSATRVVDAWGNAIVIDYLSRAEIEAMCTALGCNNGANLVPAFIDTITDSFGRIVQFEYLDLGQLYGCGTQPGGTDGMIRLTSITLQGSTRGFEYEYIAHCGAAGSPIPQNPLATAGNLNVNARALLTSAGPIGMGNDYKFQYRYDVNGSMGDSGTGCAAPSERHCELTELTYPTGATISYEYTTESAFVPPTLSHRPFRAVSKREISGPLLKDASWEYLYDRTSNPSKNYHTQVTHEEENQVQWPRERYFYYGIEPFRPGGSPSDPAQHGNWKSGVILERKLLEGSTVLETQTYDWRRSQPALAGEATWNDQYLGIDADIWIPQLEKVTTERGSDQWVTENTSFSTTTLQPICSTTTGPDNDKLYSIRTTMAWSEEYESPSDNDTTTDAHFTFRALPYLSASGRSQYEFSSSECSGLSSVNFSPTSTKGVAREYDTSPSWGGLVKIETNDQEMRFEYHAGSPSSQPNNKTGLIKSEIIAVTDGRGVCSRVNSYEYGVATDTDHGIRVNGATGSCTGSPAWTTTADANLDGSINWSRDARSKQISFHYDEMGRIDQIEPPLGADEIFEYEMGASNSIDGRSAKQCRGSCSSTSPWSETLVDGLGRPIASRNSAGNAIRGDYDARSRLIFEGFPEDTGSSAPSLDRGIEIEYDPFGRIKTKKTKGVSSSHDWCEEYTYSIDSNDLQKTEITRFENSGCSSSARTRNFWTRSFGTPDSGDLVRVQLAGESQPSSDQFLYDDAGRLVETRYADLTREVGYDGYGRVASETHPESGTRVTGFDRSGKLRCVGPNTGFCNPSKAYQDEADSCGTTFSTDPFVEYVYDSAGRLQDECVRSGETTTRTYEGADLIETIATSEVHHEYVYTNSGKVDLQTVTLDPGGGAPAVVSVTDYEYDSRDRLSIVEYPSGRRIRFAYDNHDRLEAVTDATAGSYTAYASDIEYHPNGAMKTIDYGNGYTATLDLDSLDRVDTIQVVGGTAGVLVDLDYNYDAHGNLSNLTDLVADSNSGAVFDYDELDRLTCARSTGGSSCSCPNTPPQNVSVEDWCLEFTYNDAGDRETTAGYVGTREIADDHIYDGSSGRLTGIESAGQTTHSYSYSSGKTSSVSLYSPGSLYATGSFSYDYDKADRITRAGTYANPTEYKYDGHGRVYRMSGGPHSCGASGETLLHYDAGGQLIAESTLEGLVLKEYVHANGRTIAELDVRAVTATPETIDFGDVPYGTPATQTFEAVNRSSVDQAFAFSWTGNFFEIDVDQILPHGPSAPYAEPADVEIDFPTPSFSGVDIGDYSDSVSACTDNGASLKLELSARVVAPKLELSLSQVNYGTLPLGDTPGGQLPFIDLEVTNSGNADLEITSWGVGNAPGVTADIALPLTLTEGASQTVRFSIDSTSFCAGPYAHEIHFETNVPQGLIDDGFSDSGILPAVAIFRGVEFDVSEVDQRGTGDGTTNTASVGLTNHASIPLDVVIEHTGAPDYNLTTPAAVSLPAGASTTVNIDYTPSSLDGVWSPFGDRAALQAVQTGCNANCDSGLALRGNGFESGVPLVNPAESALLHQGELHVLGKGTPRVYGDSVFDYALGTVGASDLAAYAHPAPDYTPMPDYYRVQVDNSFLAPTSTGDVVIGWNEALYSASSSLMSEQYQLSRGQKGAWSTDICSLPNARDVGRAPSYFDPATGDVYFFHKNTNGASSELVFDRAYGADGCCTAGLAPVTIDQTFAVAGVADRPLANGRLVVTGHNPNPGGWTPSTVGEATFQVHSVDTGSGASNELASLYSVADAPPFNPMVTDIEVDSSDAWHAVYPWTDTYLSCDELSGKSYATYVSRNASGVETVSERLIDGAPMPTDGDTVDLESCPPDPTTIGADLTFLAMSGLPWAEYAGAPRIELDSSGRWHAVWADETCGNLGYSLYYATREPGESDWTILDVSVEGVERYHQNLDLTVEGGSVAAVWTEIDNSGFMLHKAGSTHGPDADADGLADNTDTDDDGDGVNFAADSFPNYPLETVYDDADGLGNNAETNTGTWASATDTGTDPFDEDTDDDGVEDGEDAFPHDASESEDLDGDGLGNVSDPDDDGDGVGDALDPFPLDGNETTDTDLDGTGDNTDCDDDDDSFADFVDAFPLDATEWTDTDGDGIGNNADPDDDGDGFTDAEEITAGTDPLDASSYPSDIPALGPALHALLAGFLAALGAGVLRRRPMA